MRLPPVLVLVFFISICLAAKRTKNYQLVGFDIDCEFNKLWTRDAICNLTRNTNGTSSLTAMAYILKPADGLFFRVQSYVLNDNKKYIPGLLATNIDVCAFSEGHENFWIERFFPNVKKWLKDVLRPCPYEGQITLKNFPVDGSMLTKFLPAGRFRIDNRIYNLKNDTLASIKIFVVIRK